MRNRFVGVVDRRPAVLFSHPGPVEKDVVTPSGNTMS
jgi:hypothetical protein